MADININVINIVKVTNILCGAIRPTQPGGSF